MAPNQAAADSAYNQAVKKLKVACTFLEGQLSPPEPEQFVDIPSDRPKQRDVIVRECQFCEAELQELEAEDRPEHACSHHQQLEEAAAAQRDAETGAAIAAVVRVTQPNTRLIQRYLTDVDNRLDTFTTTLCTLSAFFEDEDEQAYSDHLMVWVGYCGWLRNRAYAVLEMIENANNPNQVAHAVASTGGPTVVTTGGNLQDDTVAVSLVQGSAPMSTAANEIFLFGQPHSMQQTSAPASANAPGGFCLGQTGQSGSGSSVVARTSVSSAVGLNASAVTFTPLTNTTDSLVGQP